METPQLVDKNSSCHGYDPQKKEKKNSLVAHAIGNVRMMTCKMRGVWGRIYPSWMKMKMVEKGGYPTKKITFFKTR